MRTRPRAVVRVAVLLAAATLFVIPAVPAHARGTVRDVSVQENTFTPTPLTIRVGNKVRWTNHGRRAHTTTSDRGLWDETLVPGEVFTFRFTTQGTFRYTCTIHSGMTGTITVTS